MSRRRFLNPALLSAFLGSGLWATAVSAGPLEERIAEIAGRPEFAGSTFGVVVRRLRGGELVYALRPRTLLPPASTTKLVSCAGALATLGKDFRWETRIVRTGPVNGGVLRGDLVLVASGDPNLSQRVDGDGRLRFSNKDHTYAGFSDAAVVPGDPLVILRRMVREVSESGIREIQGDVVVDDGLFAETRDSFIGRFSAVCINDNVVDITVSPGDAAGDRVEVEYLPKLPSIRVTVSARTGEAGSPVDLWVEPREGPASFEVLGSLPQGSGPVLRVGRLARPAVAAAHVLADLLEQTGIRVGGKRTRARYGPAIYNKYPVAARHVSPPLSETIRVILKVSHNIHATMLPVVVGALKGERGDRASGYALMRSYFEEAGLDVGSVTLQSGSGGGRADRMSAAFLVDLLRHMAAREDFPSFYEALPVAGVDGTLAGRLRRPWLRRRVRAKTGTLVYRSAFNDRWIYISKALAGYLDLRRDEHPEDIFAFAILIGNTISRSRKEGADLLFRAQEDILEAIAVSVR